MAKQADSLAFKLKLYRAAVQHPEAEVSFLLRVLDHYHDQPEAAVRLKEDFAGSAAVSTMWVQWDMAHQAVAVDLDQATLDWAAKKADEQLGARISDLHLICADVLDLSSPAVDIVAALNFSTFIYHTHAELVVYFKHALKSLDAGGVLVIDAFGGPGAMRPGVQRRKMSTGGWLDEDEIGEEKGVASSAEAGPGDADPAISFEYLWEQKSFDPVTGRIDCRIHFEFDDGSDLRDAFCYDWRLWTLPELTAAMTEAGFEQAQVWCDELDQEQAVTDPEYKPRARMLAREDWVAYVVGRK